jgi:biotin carboxylase
LGRADHVIVADITRAEPTIGALDEIMGAGRLAGIVSITEYGLVVAAEVARARGLPGLSPEAAGNARNKQRTRRISAAAGVPCPRFAWATSAAEAVAAAEEIGFPCVVKPPSEAGGSGVGRCNTAAEVAKHYDAIGAATVDRRGYARAAGVLVEEYLVGYEVSVELVYVDGEHHVLGLTDAHFAPPPPFVEVGQTFPSLLPESVQTECGEVAVAALRAIGHEFGPAHVEVKVTSSGPRLMEVNARMAGAQVTRLMYEAIGFDFPKEVVRLAAGSRPDLVPQRTGAAAVRYMTASAGGVVGQLRGDHLAARVPGIVEVGWYVAPGDSAEPPRDDGGVLGHVISVGRTPGEAACRADAALGLIAPEVLPRDA